MEIKQNTNHNTGTTSSISPTSSLKTLHLRTSIKTGPGFTIVELLIVIVVIGILAAISIVSYNGIQNRTHDTVIKTDIKGLAKIIQLAASESGEFPSDRGATTTAPGVSTGSFTQFLLVQFEPNKNSYTQVPSGGVPNLIYCTGTRTSTGQKVFALYAQSKSLNSFRYSSDQGMQEMGSVNSSPTPARACSGIGYPYNISYGYLNNNWYL